MSLPHNVARSLLPLALVIGSVSAAYAQIIEVTESPLTAYTQNGITPSHGPDPTPFVRIYVNVLPTDFNQLLSTGPTAADQTRHRYAAFDFVFSATSRVLMSDRDDAERTDLKALSELKHGAAHVRAEVLGADKKTVLASSRSDPALLAVAMAPSEIAFGQAATPSAAMTTALGAATPYLGPVGSLVSTFMANRQLKPSLAFFAYQSADGEFGWNWYETPEATIEGAHRSAALLQLKNEAAYIRLSIELVTDWRRFGVWTKSYSFLLALPPAPKPPAK